MVNNEENISLEKEKKDFFRRRRRLIFILSSGIFIILFFVANKWRFDLNIEKVEIKGNRLIPVEVIIKESGVKINSGLYDYDLKEIENRVEKIPYVKKAVVQRELPSTLSIKIVERKPLAICSNNNLYYIDDEKKIMRYNMHHKLLDLPVITGIKIDTLLKNNVIDSVIYILKTLRENYFDLYNQISEIYIKNHSEIVFYSNNYCIPIIIGQENILHRLENLYAFWNTYAIYENLNNIKSIDLRYNDQVVVRMNNKL